MAATDQGFCCLYSAPPWLRTYHSCPKAFPREWAIRNLHLEVSPFWSRKTKGQHFPEMVSFLGVGVFWKGSCLDRLMQLPYDMNGMFKLWLGTRFLTHVLHLCFFCVWLLGNMKQKCVWIPVWEENFMLLWSPIIQATNPLLQDSE